MLGAREIPVPCGIFEDERAFLDGLMTILPEGARVINIGALAGCSAVAMLRGAADIEDFHLWSIDVEARPEEMQYARACGLADPMRFSQVCGDSKIVGCRWPSKVHLVFIDGDHSYEGCKGDIEAWEPHIVESGYLVVHDYESWFDFVTEAVDEWFREAKKRGWLKVAKVDVTVAFKRGGLGVLFSQWLAISAKTVTARFMRGEA